MGALFDVQQKNFWILNEWSIDQRLRRLRRTTYKHGFENNKLWLNDAATVVWHSQSFYVLRATDRFEYSLYYTNENVTN